MILYIDAFSGLSGNMMIAGLLDLGVMTEEDFKDELDKLKVDGLSFKLDRVDKKGISANYFSVTQDGLDVEEKNHTHDHHHHHHHHEHECCHSHGDDRIESCHCHHEEEGHHHHEHRNLYDIEKIIDESFLNDRVKNLSKKMFRFVADAESKIHNLPFESLHFHEVGALDSIADIVGTAILMDKLNPDSVISSEVNTGKGFVECAHGIMPVPAPATLEIISKGRIKVYQGEQDFELLTPTGAAILATFVSEYMPMPKSSVEKIGYGAGKKDYEIPNLVRLILTDGVKKN